MSTVVSAPKRCSFIRQESSHIWLCGYFFLNEKENISQITVSVITNPLNKTKRIEHILHKKMNNYICETRTYNNDVYTSQFEEFNFIKQY